MSPDTLVELAASVLCCLTFVFLAYRRWRHQRGALRMSERRLFFVDLLLVVAGLEITFDAFAFALPDNDLGMAFRLLRLVTLGGLAVGGVSLLLTQPPIEERARPR